MSKTVKTAALVASPLAEITHDDKAFVANLLGLSAKERMHTLMTLTPGEVAAIAGMSGALAASCYEVLAIKMDQKHGKGWADRKYGGRALTDLEKQERDSLKADIEGMRSTFKANGYSNADMAIKYVKDWSRGLKGQKREPGQNKARPTTQYLHDEMPKLYRRLNNADDVTENAVALMDSIGAYLEAEGMNLRKVLGE